MPGLLFSTFKPVVRPPIRRPAPWNKTDSIALVASDGNHGGIVLAWHGNDISADFEAESSRDLESHNLSKAPEGLSIWEGRMACDGGTFDDPVPDCCLEGTFRELTDVEWKNLQLTGTPWEFEPEPLPEDCDACAGARVMPDDAGPNATTADSVPAKHTCGKEKKDG